MIVNKVKPRCQSAFFNLKLIKLKSSVSLDLEKLEREGAADIPVVDEEVIERENKIQQKRNKSRLKEHDRNILMEKRPYSEAKFAYQGTLKYNRRLYGRYGVSSNVDPSLCWPTRQELDDAVEYEKVAYPFTISEMIELSLKKRQAEEETIRQRQETIIKKMEKLDDWVKDLHIRMAKKEAEATAAKERKERLVEEVRRHFGYTVDPKDEKFKEMLEKKEKEQKKAMKEARKKAREEKMLTKLLSKGQEISKSKMSVEVETKAA